MIASPIYLLQNALQEKDLYIVLQLCQMAKFMTKYDLGVAFFLTDCMTQQIAMFMSYCGQ